MAFRIQNNIAALNAQRNLGISEAGMNKSLQRLSSGYRINSASDDAAGLSISTRFRANIASIKVAQRNIAEANSLLQVAEGAMSQIGDILTRMKELATQAASANAGTDLDKIDAEFNQLRDEITRIVDSTQYQGTKLIDGSFGKIMELKDWDEVNNNKVSNVDVRNAYEGDYTVTYDKDEHTLTIDYAASDGSFTISETVDLDNGRAVNFEKLGISFAVNPMQDLDNWTPDTTFSVAPKSGGTDAIFQVGYDNSNYSRLFVSLANLSVGSSGLAINTISLAAQTDAQSAIATLDTAINKLAEARGNIGALINRFNYAGANLDTTLENFVAAESTIRDADMAQEMTSFTKNQILVQAGVAMLSQANQAPQLILSLFR
ncbi:MAG: flagellin [Syntrophales bacterium]|nr:flagellin [Syntrophales bacterium]